MTDNSPILELKDVSVKYGNVEALHNINLKVFEGEIVSILGANGAGKSTTLMTISGLVKPHKGEILFDSKRIDGIPAHETVEKGVIQVPEGRRVFGTLTVMENLKLGAFTVKDDSATKKTVEWIFELFPILKQRKKQLAGTLSGGEQQMLAIGRALMSQPKILLLDEPSLGLAPLIIRTIFETIKEINRQGVTVVLVEQNARAALKLANRGYVLEVGKIILEDNADSLLQNPEVQNAYLGGKH
ncbi:ABC transporter ATP-binding protein [Desulforegula conservatrix]|uniref:ABC transporter ATP-binding protein n=1 Tax=Desulforegula conservatrix TaxID=153026 RepID=UPI00040BD353|nr:ABC transporter ATP-binding protein [Desulforegula conservatrix]